MLLRRLHRRQETGGDIVEDEATREVWGTWKDEAIRQRR